MINSELKSYIENSIFPEYSKNEEGHGIKHINTVIERSFKLAKDYDVNLDMVYTIASYHDIGHHINKDKHEEISAEIMLLDNNLSRWFNDEERIIIKEAIEDHRASLNREPRSIYGKIVSTADRNNTIEQCFFRSYSFSKKANPNLTENEIFEEAYKHLNNKFGVNGYAKVYLKDEEYDNFLIEIQKLLSDKQTFIKEHKKYIEKSKKEGKI